MCLDSAPVSTFVDSLLAPLRHTHTHIHCTYTYTHTKPLTLPSSSVGKTSKTWILRLVCNCRSQRAHRCRGRACCLVYCFPPRRIPPRALLLFVCCRSSWDGGVNKPISVTTHPLQTIRCYLPTTSSSTVSHLIFLQASPYLDLDFFHLIAISFILEFVLLSLWKFLSEKTN